MGIERFASGRGGSVGRFTRRCRIDTLSARGSRLIRENGEGNTVRGQGECSGDRALEKATSSKWGKRKRESMHLLMVGSHRDLHNWKTFGRLTLGYATVTERGGKRTVD